MRTRTIGESACLALHSTVSRLTEKREKMTTVLKTINQRDDFHDDLFFPIHLFSCLLV